MNKHILFLGFLLIVFGLRLDAQTLKNIHRHNQPVLRIPTHLIDKVETAEVNGSQVLQVSQLNGYVSEIPLAQIDSITHSEGEAVDPAQLGNLRTASVMGVVSGPTGAPEMNAIIRSPYGGEETRTDPNGVFFLNNILVYDKLGYITITKPGFHQGSRSFLPLQTGSNRVNVQLLPMTQSGTFSAATGGSVTSGLLQLTFPANAVNLNGEPYTGTVSVYAASLDPSSTNMFDRMPGELLGGLNDSLRLLRSFGMASVELRDTNMNELQLATGVSATLTFNIPVALQAEAPTTIDWWSFDETLGYWKHEGEAQKTGTQYIGQASHFSWWNCDVPENFNDFQGNIHSVDGSPISDALVNVVTQTLGTGVTYTNSAGTFSGRVPKNQLITLNVFVICNTTNDWTLSYSETISSSQQPLYYDFTASLDGHYPITGALINCDNQPVDLGYIRMGTQIFTLNQGVFVIQVCQTGTYNVLGYDITDPDSIKVSESVALQVDNLGANAGNISTCYMMFGTVSDIDGNIYPTALIGNQIWMTENLATTRFKNGIDIPIGPFIVNTSDTNNYRWEYPFDTLTFLPRGYLYNGFVCTDTSGVCPTGWHVASDQDFAELELFIGIPPESIFIISSNRGSEFNVARKLKATSYWGGDYNMNYIDSLNTNSTGFSALPSGSKWTPQGWFLMGIGGSLELWTSTEATTQGYNISRGMIGASSGVTRYSYEKRVGFSIRCVKD